MHLGHAFVTMGASLVLNPAVLEKQVHQHGLAAADLTIDIEAVGWATILAFVGKQPAEQALLARRLISGKPFLERREGLRGLGLRGIRLDRSGSDQGLILLVEGIGRVGGLHAALSAPDSQKLQAVNRGRRYANA